MDERKCNGWTNHVTWLVNVHLGDNFAVNNYDSVDSLSEAIKDKLCEWQENSRLNPLLDDLLSSSISNVDCWELASKWYSNYLDNVIDLTYLETCDPSYFSGHSGLYLSVSLYPNMSVQDLVEAMDDAIQCCDFGQWDLVFEDGSGLADLDLKFLFRKFIERTFNLIGNSVAITNELSNDSEVYLYVAIETI